MNTPQHIVTLEASMCQQINDAKQELRVATEANDFRRIKNLKATIRELTKMVANMSDCYTPISG